jgi:hypothetical protein
MSDNRSFERAMDDWLADVSDRAPKPAVDAVLLAVKTTPQERDFRVPWRNPIMTTPLRLVAAIAIVVALGAATFSFMGRNAGIGGTPAPFPTPTPTATPAPSPSSSASGEPLDTTTWLPYSSARYGFDIAHPADWALEAAPDHDWALPADALFPNAATEHFTYSEAVDGQGIGVSAWSVPVESGTTVESWLQAYCDASTYCSTVPREDLPVTMDGHPGALYSIGDAPHAIFLVDDRIYVVACWRSDGDPTALRYGGSRSLVEAFVSTMRLTSGGASPSP